MAPLPRNAAHRLAAALGSLALLAGCVNGTDADEDTVRDAAIYRSVITDLVARSGADLDGSAGLSVVFVEAFSADGIPLPVQVEVVTGLGDRYEIRFVDDRAEAVDVDLPGAPVRLDSLLVGLGPLVVDDTAKLRGELYLAADDVQAYDYTLVSGANDEWNIVDSPVEIEPEGFVSEA